MKLFASAAAALLLFAVSTFAADVDGKWTGSVHTDNGDFPVTFNFTAAGDVLALDCKLNFDDNAAFRHSNKLNQFVHLSARRHLGPDPVDCLRSIQLRPRQQPKCSL